MTNKHITLPLLALRDTVVFPKVVESLLIGRLASVQTIIDSFEGEKTMFVATQRDATQNEIVIENLYPIGTVVKMAQLVKLADGTVKVVVEGLYRAKIQDLTEKNNRLSAKVITQSSHYKPSKTLDGMRTVLISAFQAFCQQTKKLPPEVANVVAALDDIETLCDTIASYIPLKVSEQQEILSNLNLKQRMEKVIIILEDKAELFNVEKRIKNRVKQQVEKNQKEYYLNEQLKAINKELGNSDEQLKEIQAYEDKILACKMPQLARDKAFAELKKLKNMSPISQENAIIRNYLDWLINIPWRPTDTDPTLQYAEKILNQNHYGLEKVKDRILEYIAVQKRVQQMKAQIMCFVGPPGVGKTSLGKAIADAIQRPFVRIALGGISDEAEIRGHRKTYIGAMPGKIIQSLKRVNASNPVIMLDEIDKIGMDGRGDPAAALLEVLDPEQNNSFVDNYLEIPYDLSQAVFIATANSYDIPLPLIDRMELIYLNGYSEEEKMEIAKKFIIAEQKKENGLQDDELEITDDAIIEIIRHYTMESGVRGLKREIGKISRKVTKKLLNSRKKSVIVDKKTVKDYLGVIKYNELQSSKKSAVGVVHGLAWTEMGGDVLTIEALKYPGSGQLITTGKLGEVMQESIKAAFSFVKSQSSKLGINDSEFVKNDIHVHVPEGAVPKDGPSAGITLCSAIVSTLTRKKIRADIAMTGEITLVGNVLPIGGLREKLLAAKRNNIYEVLIPKENEKDLAELPESLRKDMKIIGVSHMKEVLKMVFVE